MSSAYQEYVKRLKQRAAGTEPYFRECVQNPHLTPVERGICHSIMETEAMRAGIKAAKVISARGGGKGTDPDMDAVQEATAAALQAIGTWNPDGGSTLTGWVTTRALGAAFDWYRRERGFGMGGRDHIADIEDIAGLIDEEDSDNADSPLAVEPMDDVIAEHDSGMIEELINTLPPELRNIVVSYYGYRTARMTLAELAARENVSVGTIRNRLAEAIALLRENGDILGIGGRI